MSNWHEQLYDNLSRLNANEQKSKASSVTPVRSIMSPNPNPIPIAVGCGGMTGLVTRSKAASTPEGNITEKIEGNNRRVGYRENGTIAWTMKAKLKTTPAEDLRAMIFD